MNFYSLDDFYTPERRDEFYERQAKILSASPDQERRIIRRERAADETLLLMEAVKNDIIQLEKEGVLQVHGRTWTLNF